VAQDIKFEIVKKISEANFKNRDFDSISQLNSFSPPSIFIGSRLKYPEVNVGILSPIDKDEKAWIYDDAKYWVENNFEVIHILYLRNNLLNSRFRAKVMDARIGKKFLDISKEIAIASKPVNVEIKLKSKISFTGDRDRVLMPNGLNTNLQEIKITENVKVNHFLDKIIEDDELKVSESMQLLYNHNFDEYSLSKILSVGVLGLKKDRRLVPTRWSITASDDIIGKYLIKRIKDYKWIEDYRLFYEEFLGNQYLILMLPNVWSFELFELYLPGSSWNPSSKIKASTDMENYDGRKNYAINTSGGYYATRLSILKYLESIKRQASVLVIRIETPSYWTSLGVWVVRESVKRAMEKNIDYKSMQEIINNAKKISNFKYNFDVSEILNKSKLLKNSKTQKNLIEYFR